MSENTCLRLFAIVFSLILTACGGGGGGGGGGGDGGGAGVYTYDGSSTFAEHTVQVQAGNAYTFSAEAVSGDFYFIVYDGTYAGVGETIPESMSTVSTGSTAKFSFIATADETYHLLFAPNNSSGFSYRFASNSKLLTVDGAAVTETSDADNIYYAFDVLSGENYEVELISTSGTADIGGVFPDMNRSSSFGSSRRTDVNVDKVGFTATSTGRYYLRVEPESNTSYSVAVNNITTQPDLEVIIRNVESDGANLYIYYTIYNNGIDASGSILLDAWSDLAVPPTLGEPATESRIISDVSGYSAELGTFIIPETAPSGTAYLAVDTANTAAEKNENNNISAAAAWVATEPDLQVSVENVYADGNNAIIEYRLQNTGSRDAGDLTVQVWANSATAPVVGDIGDTSESFFSLSAGANFTRTVTVPNADTSGTAYAIIDSQDIVNESVETNNVSAGQPWVITYPDLQVSVDAVASNGTNIEIDYTVTNGLENYAPAFNVDFVSDSSGAPSVGVAGEYSVSHTGLAPGESLSDTAVFSSVLSSGTAYAVVDTGELVTETNEANNVSNGMAWTATYPDLQVVVERVISDGTNADVRIEIHNEGPGDAGSFDVELWAEATGTPTMGDVGDHTETFNFTSYPLSSGAYTSRVITMPVTQATAIAYAIVDTGNVVAETDDTNNISLAKEWATTYFSADTFQTIPDADLVTGVSAGIDLAGAGVTTSIARMVVGVNIWHDNLREIDIYLESPAGTMIELSTDNDGCGSGNYGDSSRDTLFDDLASTSITVSNDCSFLDAYIPEQALATFNGENANGNWILHVYDDDNTYSYPEGTMRSFSISVW